MTFNDRHHDTGRPPDRNQSSTHSSPMGRIIEMAFSGLWVIKRQGVLTEAGGRLYWPDRQSLERAASQAGIPLSDVVVHTGRLDADSR
ncbi:hypothetical protein FZ983_12855 [Azospirillum sp. B21]|uniref:hypothetical protein n=1 Tax=Azospirillum sp. B21 TaxID=2607496 RepID=UPI0011EECCD5|nr:hypothetical protein [Azospirillum sp. B21]KAA0580461.1 hypothetical protein FZ983_12855 [Azospirillum sp. B21]